MSSPGRCARLVGVPMDLGAGRRGVDMGPTALRLAGLAEALRGLGYEVSDAGNLHVPQRESLEEGDPCARFLEPIAAICQRLHGAVLESLQCGCVPLVLGGDHALSIGSISAAAKDAARRGQRLGVIWLDAHGDMNTAETTPSGNIHGMTVSCLLGRGRKALLHMGGAPALYPEDIALIGVRDLDPGEVTAIRELGVRALTMRDLDRHGLHALCEEALEGMMRRCSRLHVSLDMDFVDPTAAPGVGTPVRGGPTFREAHLVMELLASTGCVSSVDVVEINPILDHGNTTAQLAVDLLSTLFGRRIL
jgi:arginase